MKKFEIGDNLAWVLMVALIVILNLILAHFRSQGQPPERYWTFNTTTHEADSMGKGNLSLNGYGNQYTIEPGLVGNSLNTDPNGTLITSSDINLSNQLVVEFLFKPGPNVANSKIIYSQNGNFFIGFDYPKITFATDAGGYDEFVVNLDGIGRKSYSYYTDGDWHHMVFRFNGQTGYKDIWVDGQSPSGFSKTTSSGNLGNTGTIFMGSTVHYVVYYGGIDEIALYNTYISNELIYKHYLEAQSGLPYSSIDDYTGNIPAPAPVTAGVDLNEFPPGHPNVSILPTDQLKKFPSPRYKPGHTLMRNFNWMDPRYQGGQFQSWASTTTQVAQYSKEIQEELALNWHYNINVSYYNGNSPIEQGWVDLANQYPNIPAALITFRAATNDLKDQNKPSNHYLQNSNGQFIDANGNPTNNKIWRPTAPISSYTNDANTINSWINSSTLQNLTRQINIVNENGELFPLITDNAMQQDPVVSSDRNSTGLSWRDYLGRRFADNEVGAYRDNIMTNAKIAPNAIFTEYTIGGHPVYYGGYGERRVVNYPINGQYYSTSDFYPRWPWNWRGWAGPWHGWQWFVESRHYELGLGDNLYSPFVAAGWDVNPESNVRPSQWLGLLKNHLAFGAEFFYTGFFSLSSPWPDSRNWIWQAAMPAYAQACISRVEPFFRNSHVMDGDIPDSYVNPTQPGYMFKSGDQSTLIVVRKHNSLNQYLITASINPNSNQMGAVPDTRTATIKLDGQDISFEVRKQGSVYFYDRDNSIFYQLDSFHESGHPYNWSDDFEIEAELFDNNSTAKIVTESNANDYSSFLSYVRWDTTPDTLLYQFNIKANSSYYLWIRAKSLDGQAHMFTTQLNNSFPEVIGCVSDTGWVWYGYELCTGNKITYTVVPGIYTLKLAPSDNQIAFDLIVLSASPNYAPGIVSVNCGGPPATITASGNTDLCPGENVVLTANTGDSYLWSNGETTQAILVDTTGSYFVEVWNGACNSVSPVIDVNLINCGVCLKADNLTNIDIQATTAKVGWSPVTQAKYYTIKLRNLQTQQVDYIGPFFDTTAVVNVTPNTRYKWWVRTKCGGVLKSDWPKFKRFKTPNSSNNVTSAVSLSPEETEEFLKNKAAYETKSLDFTIYPNPARTEINIAYYLPYESPIAIEVLDIKGNLISGYNLKINPGFQVTTVKVNYLTPGTYLIRLKSNKQTYSKELIIN